MKIFQKFHKKIARIIFLGLVIHNIFFCYSATQLVPEQNEPYEYITREQDTADYISLESLEDLIIRIVHEASERENCIISDALLSCYSRLNQGYKTVSLYDLAYAMPEILQYVCGEHEKHIQEGNRIPRPDAQGVLSQVVSCGSSCNLNRVLKILLSIKSRIGTVADPVCCNTILGILGDACACLGPDASISCTLKDLVEDFRETWTILTDIKLTLTECCADLKETITECCAELQEDFRETWTILADINETLTECCANLEEDFRQTWTILDDLKKTITECCAELERDFRETWTILQDIKDTTCDKFEQTWTILEDLNVDNTSVFTVLDAFM